VCVCMRPCVRARVCLCVCVCGYSATGGSVKAKDHPDIREFVNRLLNYRENLFTNSLISGWAIASVYVCMYACIYIYIRKCACKFLVACAYICI